MKKRLLFVCLLVLWSLTLLAQTRKSPRTAHTTEKSAIHVPPDDVPLGLIKIFSNLGKSNTDLYLDHHGWLVLGPNSVDKPREFIGMRFTPKFNSTVYQVRVAVQYFGSGANRVNLSVYGDSNGTPGTLLTGPVTVTNLPVFGTCCTLAVANFNPVAVTAGTQYWVVADTPLTGAGSDSTDAWDFVVPAIPQGFNNGSGWYSLNVNEPVAGEVKGTIP